jgi:hypothetical protein
MFPSAELPRLPGEPRPERRRRRLEIGVSKNQARVLIGAGGAAVLLIVIVLAITGAFGGDDDPTTADPTETTAEGGLEEGAEQLRLQPVGGGNASGSISIGRASEDQPFMDVAVRDLEPAPEGQTYRMWFMVDERSGYPFVALDVPPSGALSDRFVLPVEFLEVLVQAPSIDVWLNDNEEVERRIANALREGGVVKIPGERVLSGRIRRAGDRSG